MAAEIRSSIPAKPTLDGVSRDDLALAEIITVEQTPPVVGTTWAWTLVYVPEGSTATLIPPAAVTTSGPMTFTADLVGSYLVRLVVDAGLPTESTQYVRLRALTTSLGLKLVAAGERRDATGVIPVDVDIEGWANEQNFNLLALETAAATDSLADVLGVGNTTGGTGIQMTTGDKIVGETHVEIESTGAATNIVLTPDAAGAVVVNGKLTVTGLIDPTGIIFDEASSPPLGATQGGVFVSDGVAASLTQNYLYYKNGAGDDRQILTVVAGSPSYLVPYHLGIEAIPNGTVKYAGWVPTSCVLQAVRVMMQTINTQGNFTLEVTNMDTGLTCLSAPVFNMNTLVAEDVEDVPLTALSADLAFITPGGGATAGRWDISLVSDDAAFDGSHPYIELVFGVF